jgi:hypothetical protein
MCTNWIIPDYNVKTLSDKRLVKTLIIPDYHTEHKPRGACFL